MTVRAVGPEVGGVCGPAHLMENPRHILVVYDPVLDHPESAAVDPALRVGGGERPALIVSQLDTLRLLGQMLR